ncbi:MAG: hypothetical protein EON58_06510 [Alphaproteobacteria bacterium]|nr:MAG: hypothetical protein EON58_06510 [Alphaproteobacteria bacterium]
MSQLSSRTSVTRAKRRAQGMRSSETVLLETEIALLDGIKDRLGLASRSDAIRVVLSKVDPTTLTAADAAKLDQSAA